MAQAKVLPFAAPAEAVTHKKAKKVAVAKKKKKAKKKKRKSARTLVKLSRTPGKVQRPAPTLGQHSIEVLRELGYDDARIEALVRSGAVKTSP